MAKFEQNTETVRFLEVFETILKKDINLTQGSLCELIGLDGSNYSQIKKGKRNVPPKYIELLCRNPKTLANRDYIYDGVGEKLLQEGVKAAVNADEIELRILKMQVENYESQISYMQKLIDAHEKEGPLLTRIERLIDKTKK